MLRKVPGRGRPTRGKKQLTYTLPSKQLRIQPSHLSSLSADTLPEAEKTQMDLLRKATLPQRFQLAAMLSLMTLDMARAALKARYPELSQIELDRLFVTLHYGGPLARKMFAGAGREDV